MFQIAIIHPGLDHLKSDRKYKVRFVKRCTNSLPLPILFYLFLTQKDQRDTPYTNLNLRGDERWNLEPWKRWRRYSPAHPAEHTLSPCSWQKLRWKHQMPNPQNSRVMIHGWFHHEFWGSKIRRKHTSWHKLWMAQSSGWKVERKQKSHAILMDRFRSFQIFSPPKVPNVQASKGFYGFPKWLSKGFPWISKFLLGLQSKLPNVHTHSPRLQLLASPRLRFDKQWWHATLHPGSLGQKNNQQWRHVKGNGSVWWLIKYVHNILIYIYTYTSYTACMYSIVATLLECTTPKICFLIGASRTFKTLCKVRKLQQPLRLCMESSGDFSRSMCVHRLSFMHQSGPHFISPRYRNRISCSCCATWKPTPLLAPVTTSRSTASVWGKRGICDLDKRSLVSGD